MSSPQDANQQDRPRSLDRGCRAGRGNIVLSARLTSSCTWGRGRNCLNAQCRRVTSQAHPKSVSRVGSSDFVGALTGRCIDQRWRRPVGKTLYKQAGNASAIRSSLLNRAASGSETALLRQQGTSPALRRASVPARHPRLNGATERGARHRRVRVPAPIRTARPRCVRGSATGRRCITDWVSGPPLCVDTHLQTLAFVTSQSSTSSHAGVRPLLGCC